MRRLPFRCRHAAGWCLALPVLTALGGCDRARAPQFAVVEGVVTLDHEPLADVEIVFLPDPAAGNKGPRSSAYTDKQGRYRLRTDKGIDGAAVGPCFVCVNDLRVVPGVAGADASGTGGSRPPGGPGGAGGSRVPLRYNRPTETPWRIDVSPGGPHTHNFNVEGGRAK